VLAFGSNLPDFLLHSKQLLSILLTNIKLKASHVFSIKVLNGVFGVSFIVVLDESERAL
jgi:hypothetical protein